MVALLGVSLAACAWSLEGADGAPVDQTAPVAPSCAVMADGRAVHGALRSVVGADGEVRWFADLVEGVGEDGPTRNARLRGAIDATCVGLSVAQEETLEAEGRFLDGLDAVAASGGAPAVRFYSAWVFDEGAAFGVRVLGVGAATAPSLDGPWTPGPLVIGAGYPAYGVALAADEGQLYAWGCAAARFLGADCGLARVPREQVDNAAAYAFWVGSDRYTPRIDEAFPMVSAGLDPSVRRVGERWVMAYATPFGREIIVRDGVGPGGPWSAPRAVAGCALPSPEAWCTSVALHPSLEDPEGAGRVAVSYAVRTGLEAGADLPTRLAFIELE